MADPRLTVYILCPSVCQLKVFYTLILETNHVAQCLPYDNIALCKSLIWIIAQL